MEIILAILIVIGVYTLTALIQVLVVNQVLRLLKRKTINFQWFEKLKYILVTVIGIPLLIEGYEYFSDNLIALLFVAGGGIFLLYYLLVIAERISGFIGASLWSYFFKKHLCCPSCFEKITFSIDGNVGSFHTKTWRCNRCSFVEEITVNK